MELRILSFFFLSGIIVHDFHRYPAQKKNTYDIHNSHQPHEHIGQIPDGIEIGLCTYKYHAHHNYAEDEKQALTVFDEFQI